MIWGSFSRISNSDCSLSSWNFWDWSLTFHTKLCGESSYPLSPKLKRLQQSMKVGNLKLDYHSVLAPFLNLMLRKKGQLSFFESLDIRVFDWDSFWNDFIREKWLKVDNYVPTLSSNLVKSFLISWNGIIKIFSKKWIDGANFFSYWS